MPKVPCCPSCRAPHHLGGGAAGRVLICGSCQEVFEAGDPAATGPPPLPRAGAAPRPPRATPVRPRPEPAAEPDADGARQTRILLMLAAGAVGVLFVVLAALGTGAWLVVTKIEQDRTARAEQQDREAEAARQRADAEHLAQLQARKTRDDNPAPGPPAPEPAPPVVAPGPDPDAPAIPPGPGGPPINPFPPAPGGPPINRFPPGLAPDNFLPPRPQQGGPVKAVAPVLPEFKEVANPFKPGTQTTLRGVASVPLPKLPAPAKANGPGALPNPPNEHSQLVHAPKHGLLFVRSPKAVWVYDLETRKAVGEQAAKELFTDMSLSPDGAALFVADYGGERVGRGDPINPSRVHRFDLAARKWEDRKAPRIAYRIEAVDPGRVLLLERDQWVSLTLNKWEGGGAGVRELSRVRSSYGGDIEYDPRTGRVTHGSLGMSSPELTLAQVSGDEVQPAGRGGSKNVGGYGAGVALSRDGTRLYYGCLQVDAGDVGKNLRTFPEPILAASRDVAFAGQAYYHAATGSKLGAFEFKVAKGDPERDWLAVPPAVTVSPDGATVWVIDRDKNVARRFAIDGEK